LVLDTLSQRGIIGIQYPLEEGIPNTLSTLWGERARVRGERFLSFGILPYGASDAEERREVP